jgi:hypothetical protein
VISRGTGQGAHAIRRATTAMGAAAGCLVALIVTARLTGGSAAPGPVLRMVADLAVGMLVALLAPAAVRVLAHPRGAALPARSRSGAVAGLTGALGCLLVGFATTMADRLAGGSGLGGPVAGRVLPAVLAGLALAATAVAAGLLHGVRMTGASERRSALPARPDLFDDLALLSARTLPGSPTARTLAWCNRGLDRWAWSPRRRAAAASGAASGAPSGLGRVRPQPE